MVKSVIYTLTAIALCLALFICVEIYLNRQFDEFGGAIDTLYKKVEDETANREDGYAVKKCGRTKRANCTFLYRTTIFRTWTTGLTKPADSSTPAITTGR